MIPVKEDQYTVDSNLTGETIMFKLEKDAIVHLMSVLTNLYSDRMLAVIREYATNARDAHIEAGNKNPIEISLPSQWTPVYKVKDYGVGMSYEDIVNVYTSYGNSTKRDSNLVTGMLGLGSKSALTYSSQFTCVSVKNGEKVVVVISKNEDGIPEAKVVGRVLTNESNGTEIQVPVKFSDMQTFNTKAHRFFRFWQYGSVLIDGKEPAHNHTEVGDILFSANDYSKTYVVMGDVAYPLTDSGISTTPSLSIAIRVPIGTFSIAPNREALSLTRDQESALKSKLQKAVESIQAYVEKRLNAQPDIKSAFAEWEKMFEGSYINGYSGYNRIPAVWNGISLGQSFTVSSMIRKGGEFYKGNYGHTSISLKALSDYDNIIIVLHGNARKEMAEARAHHFVDSTIVLFCEDNHAKAIKSVVEKAKVITWDEFKAYPRVKSAARPKSTGPRPIRLFTTGGYYSSIEVKDIPNDALWFVTSNSLRFYSDDEKTARKLFPGKAIVIAAEGRKSDILKYHGAIDDYFEEVRKKYEEAKRVLGKRNKAINSIVSSFNRNLRNFTFSDPKLESMKLEFPAPEEEEQFNNAAELRNLFYRYGHVLDIPYSNKVNDEYALHITNNYPLFERVHSKYMSSAVAEDLYKYIEMKWRESNVSSVLSSK